MEMSRWQSQVRRFEGTQNFSSGQGSVRERMDWIVQSGSSHLRPMEAL